MDGSLRPSATLRPKAEISPQQLWSGLAVITDGLGVWAAIIVGFYLRSLSPHALLPIDIYAGLATVCVVCYWGITASLGGYTSSRLLSRFDEWIVIFVSLCLAFGLVLAGAFFIRSISLSRLVVGYAALIALLGLTVSRAGLRSLIGWLRSQGYGIRQVIWVGYNPLLIDVLDRLDQVPDLGFQIVGQVLDPEGYSQFKARSHQTLQPPVVASLPQLGPYLRTYPQITEVWFAQPELATVDLLLSLQTLPRPPAQIRLLPNILAYLTVNFSLQALDGIPLFTLQHPPLSYWHNRLLKRSFDIVGATLGLVGLSPFLLGIALAVKASSPGPIFYQQERISLEGQPFKIYKFRTMKVDAESTGQPGWTRPNDTRRTQLGIWLRQFNLDELPQLWNVLKGEMSLVGPRPERPYYVEQFSQAIPKYLDRHLVKTGLTGWAQIHGLRGDTSIPRRTQYDLYYVQNWSLLLDLRIIASTLWQGLKGQIYGY